MRGRKSGDSFVLKYRLTGAAVLIGFAVVVLPILLGGPGEEPDSRPAEATRDESQQDVFRSNVTPIGGETPSVDAAADADRGGDADSGAAAQGAKPSAGAGATAAPARQEQDAAGADSPPADEAATDIDRGWIVQVGTFKRSDNVDKLVAKLESGGFTTSTSRVSTDSGMATRVWVGPYKTRVQAARGKTRVKQHTGSEGLIVAYP